MRELAITVTLAASASLVAAPLVAVPARTAIGVVARDIPGVPPTDPPPPPPPPPPTPEPAYTPAPYEPDPGYTWPPEYLLKPGEIAKMRLSFKEVATKGRMTVSWSSSERATSYQARITKVVLQVGTKGPNYKKAKPQPWKETGQARDELRRRVREAVPHPGPWEEQCGGGPDHPADPPCSLGPVHRQGAARLPARQHPVTPLRAGRGAKEGGGIAPVGRDLRCSCRWVTRIAAAGMRVAEVQQPPELSLSHKDGRGGDVSLAVSRGGV